MVVVDDSVENLLEGELRKLAQSAAQATEWERVYPLTGDGGEERILTLSSSKRHPSEKGDMFTLSRGQVLVGGVGRGTGSGFEVETPAGDTLLDRPAYQREPTVAGWYDALSSGSLFVVGLDRDGAYMQALRQDHGDEPFVLPPKGYNPEEDGPAFFEPYLAVMQADDRATRNAQQYVLGPLTDVDLTVRVKELVGGAEAGEEPVEEYTGQEFSL